MGKIRLRCQIGDLKLEVTVYIIDADTSYNLLLGRPWIHKNHIVPSTLHQVMKYVDAQGQVRTLVAEQRPFKGVENYFTDALLYQDAHEVVARQKDELMSGSEADVDPDSKSSNEDEECELDLKALDALNLSDHSAKTIEPEDTSDSDCAWEFDASALE